MAEATRLVARSKEGDRNAFAQLFDEHRDRIYSLVWHLVDGPETAADLTAEAFVRAWEQLPRLREEQAFPSWLRRIAVNLARDWQRRQQRERAVAAIRVEGADDPEPELPSDEAGPLEQLEAAELVTAARAALKSLPEHYREVATLYYVEDLPVAEVAEALGLPRNTVVSRLSRARTALRRKLARYVEGEAG